MDDDLEKLEAELKRLRPAAPAPALAARIGRDLAARPAQDGLAPMHRLWAVALPAAAAAVALLLQFVPPEAERGAAPVSAFVAPDTALKPVAAENLLVAARDEGLVTLADGTTARRERLQFVDTIVWKNPSTRASLTWTVPREEVRVVPVVFQ
jgi:hypothetical protein